MDILGVSVTIPGWILTLFLIVLSLYLYSKYKQSYFRRLGYPGPHPTVFIGGLGRLRKLGREAVDHENVRKYGKCYAGFICNTGGLTIADAEMVKEICIKEFSSFRDRSQVISVAKFWKLSLSNATGDHWKYMRSILSRAFSTSKLRNMDPLIQKCVDSFVISMEMKLEESDVVNLQKAFNDITMDIIAATAFGMDIDCQTGQDTEFSKMAARCLNVKAASTISILITLMFPYIRHVLDVFGGIDFIDKVAANYMKAAANGVIEERRRSRINGESNHNDLLDLMLRAHELEANTAESGTIFERASRKPGIVEMMFLLIGRVYNTTGDSMKPGLTDDEILANAVFFLLAGYDTTATTMTWTAYCLATNTECQERLIDEIDTKLGKERPSYGNVLSLQYLDALVSETLRLYPPAGRTNRQASNDVTICGHFIPAGTHVSLAISAMHRLEEYWPDPERFDPERFLPENKATIVPFTYLPFGVGPRDCIGQRLALLEIKVTIVTLLQRYRIHKTDRVQVPPKTDKLGMFLKPADGMFLRIEKRE